MELRTHLLRLTDCFDRQKKQMFVKVFEISAISRLTLTLHRKYVLRLSEIGRDCCTKHACMAPDVACTVTQRTS